MKIYVKMMNGYIITLDIEPNSSVALIKRKIEDMEGFCTDQQRLLFRGLPLEDYSTVQQYGIQDGNTINLLITLRSGTN